MEAKQVAECLVQLMHSEVDMAELSKHLCEYFAPVAIATDLDDFEVLNSDCSAQDVMSYVNNQLTVKVNRLIVNTLTDRVSEIYNLSYEQKYVLNSIQYATSGENKGQIVDFEVQLETEVPSLS